MKALEPDDYPFLDYRSFTFSLGIVAPEGIWLSGSTAARHDADRGQMVVEGDLLDQARVIFEKMRLTLLPSGHGLRNLTRLVRYVTPDALPDLPRLDALTSEMLGSIDISTIVVHRLLRRQALIEMEASIVPSQRGLSILLPGPVDDIDARIARALDGRRPLRTAQFSSPGHAPAPGLAGLRVTSPCLPHGSAGLQVEAILAEEGSSVVHASAEGDPSIGDVVAQCRDAYRRIAEDLRAAQSSLAEVIKTTEFVSPAGLSGYRETASVRSELLARPFPAATGVVCEAISDAGTLIAVEVTARRKDAP